MQRVSDERESGIFCRYFLLKMQKGYLTIYTMYSIVLCKRRYRMDAQLRKGLLEFCVLAAIQKTDSYGYQIIKDLSLHIEISESTLYPILRRMEAGGKVESYLVEHQNRIRKYFHLTEAGRQLYADALAKIILNYEETKNKTEEKAENTAQWPSTHLTGLRV